MEVLRPSDSLHNKKLFLSSCGLSIQLWPRARQRWVKVLFHFGDTSADSLVFFGALSPTASLNIHVPCLIDVVGQIKLNLSRAMLHWLSLICRRCPRWNLDLWRDIFILPFWNCYRKANYVIGVLIILWIFKSWRNSPPYTLFLFSIIVIVLNFQLETIQLLSAISRPRWDWDWNFARSISMVQNTLCLLHTIGIGAATPGFIFIIIVVDEYIPSLCNSWFSVL